MATNLGCVWRRNIFGAKEPFKFPGSFQAGASQAIKSGEILKLSTGNFVPETSDESMSAVIAFADCEIRSGDLAGYHHIIVPRPGDIFELALASAAAPAVGASLYVSNSQTLTTSGSNVIGTVVDESMIPLQGFQSVNPSYDAGTTLRTVSKVLFVVKASVSYYAALQV
jgi:hypothetical protein